MGPLSGKEQREYIKLALDQKRKDELHALKLQEQKVSVEKAKGKANQELKQKDESHRVKLGAAPLSSIKPMEVTLEAGNEAAQTMTPLQMGAGQDTVPAMLTPGEAVIPKTVAQDPQYKPVIEQMVSEGRDRNQQMKGYNYGTPNVRGYNDGTAGVPLPSIMRGAAPVAIPAVEPITIYNPNLAAAKPMASTVYSPEARFYQGHQRPADPPAVVDPRYAQAVPPVASNVSGEPILKGYVKSLFGAESSNNPDAKNPRSSALSLGQFVHDTWEGVDGKYGMRNNYPKEFGHIPFGSEEFKSREVQERATELLLKENQDRLLKDGIELKTMGDMYATHFLGYSDAKKVLGEKDQSTPVSKLLSASVISSNPHLKDMTVADFKNWASTTINKHVVNEVPPVPEVPKSNNSTDGQLRYDNNGRLVQPLSPTDQTELNNINATLSEDLKGISPRDVEYLKQRKAALEAKSVGEVPPPAPPGVTPGGGTVPSVATTKKLVPDTEFKASEATGATGTPKTADDLIPDVVAAVEPHADRVQEIVETSKDEKTLQERLLGLFEEIYTTDGKDSMFNRKDLIRFSILAAGGLATGGSVNGSLRYAGLDVLKNSDARHDNEEKARVAASKERKPDEYVEVRHKGRTIMARQAPDKRYYAMDPKTGEPVVLKGAQKKSDWESSASVARTRISDQLDPFYRENPGLAKGVTGIGMSTLASLEAEGAFIEPEDQAAMVTKAVRNIPAPGKDATQEEIQQYYDQVTNSIYANAAVKIRENHAPILTVGGKPMDGAASSRFRTAIELDKTPDRTIDQKIDNIVAEYKEARKDPAKKQFMIDLAKTGSYAPIDVYLRAKAMNFK
jgi:hypothetical protein